MHFVRGSLLPLAIMIKRSLVLVAAAVLTSAAQAESSVVKGELSFTSTGIGQVTECGTGRVVDLGVMASNPYFLLTKKYDQISGAQRSGVLVEVKGSLVTSSNGRIVLESPSVVTLVAGTCSHG